MPSAVSADPTSIDAAAVLIEGLRLRQTDPRALLSYGERLRTLSADDARRLTYAELFMAYGRLAHGDRPAAEQALARAQAQLSWLDDLDASVLCSHLQAGLWVRDGRAAEALQTSDDTLALPEMALSPWVRQLELARRAATLEWLGRYDEALHAHYESVALARRIGAPELIAPALAGLGGLQCSLSNLEDALPPCDEAWALCEHTDWYGVIYLAAANRIGVLSLLSRHDEAVAMAERLIGLEDRFPTRHRDVRLSMCAIGFARAMQLERAQGLLDLIRSEQPELEPVRAEWVWVQAIIFNRSGRSAQALALVQPYIERYRDQLNGSRFPFDRAQLYAQAALASEALGDFAAALSWERQAAAAREQAAAQSGHARRLTLQIHHQLDAAHRARDQALREGERATLEQQRLALLNDELEAANAAKTRFLASASHDLRQPVQALTMYLAALEREPGAAQRGSLIERMGSSLQSLGQLFDALLDLSQLDAGLVRLNRAPLRLDALLRRLVDEHQLAARERGLQLRLHLPCGLQAAGADSDAALLERCLRNLIDNALKYTVRGGCVVSLRVGAAGSWRVVVRDTGPGIEPAQQALVFHEFFQIGNDERDRSRGLGLGLSIVKRTAALLQHPLGLRSRPGAGSCFHLELPRLVWPLQEGPTLTHDAMVSLGLIVIDDDAQVRDALVALLQRWGHQVLAGSDAPDTLARWRHAGQPPLHAAIVDLRLANGRTGVQAIADLRAGLGCALPALVVTGDVAPDRLQLLANAGQPWLQKPLMPMRLRSWLQGLPAGQGVSVRKQRAVSG
jgi:signal transduction histidine kinase/CheY-like chemotaxis protein